MVNLALLLSAQQASGSYAAAGIVSACYAIAVAFTAPLSGTLVDLHGPRPVLLATVALQGCAFAGYVAAVSLDAPVWTLTGTALLAGASAPPVSACCRRVMATRPDAEHRRTLFALSGFFIEAVFVAGPLLVGLVIILAQPIYSVIVAAAASTAGVLWLRSAPILRTVEPGDRGHSTRLRATGPQAVLYGTVTLGAIAIGALQVSVVAYADDTSVNAGLMTASIAIGGTVGSFLYGAMRLPGSLPRQLGVALALYGMGILTLLGEPAAAVGLVLLLVVGFCNGPADAIEALLLGEHTPPARQAQAFAFLVTANWIGFALGSAAAGTVIDHGSATAGHRVAVAAALTAAATAFLVKPPRTEPRGQAVS
jgi:MFS family permease